MKQLNMVTLNQLPFPANHLAPGELRCENASHVDVATVERAAGFGLMGNLWEPPKSMGTTKFVIYYLCYTYNVVFCFDWVKGCRGDIPLENLDFGIIAPPVGTPWYIYIYTHYRSLSMLRHVGLHCFTPPSGVSEIYFCEGATSHEEHRCRGNLLDQNLQVRTVLAIE